MSSVFFNKYFFSSFLKKVILFFILFYQKIFSPDHGILSGFLPYACRFKPTCSEYAYQAINKYGIIKGGWLGVKRVWRCNPWSKGGHDRVP